MTDIASQPAINDDGLSAGLGEVETYGYLSVGPRYTGDRCTGVWLRIASRDPLNRALRRKNVRHIELTSFENSPYIFEATATFAWEDPTSYTFEDMRGEDLYVEVTDKHVPVRLWREVSEMPAGSYLTLEASLYPDGIFGMSIPTRAICEAEEVQSEAA